MNRARSVIACLIIFLPGVLSLWAQEVITPLHKTGAAQQYTEFLNARKSANAILLELPVFDDFSNSSLTADTSIWSDANAFVNNNFCVNPITNGVATLDALDAAGSIYSHAVISPSTFVADTLTSHPINLAYPSSDSIYLSFVYQPGGLCDLPEEQDSLMVDFWAVDSSEWVNAWRIPGTGMHSFKHVMIPLNSERFLTSGFKFRFRNRASLSRSNEAPDKRSNVDYWHVDYIRLDRFRTASDTIPRDVAFNSSLTPVFKELTTVPWSHLEKAYNTTISPFVSARYRNNDSITRNVTRSLTILEPIYGESQTPGIPTAQDLPAFDETVVDFAFPYDLDFDRGDSALLRFKAALRTDEFDPKVNDTLIHDQLFRDYYAYDDGTAEAGYGLRGDATANGMVAIKHYSYEADMLGGVYIFFNQVYDSLNLKQYTFNLMVWDDAGGNPGSVIWEDETIRRPIYTPTYSGFIKYEFSEPVPVDGPFYVGWKQYKEYLLNVGLDLNNKHTSPQMFYSLGSWTDSKAPGTLLFRPFMYDSSTGIDPSPDREMQTLQIYPNPASGQIWFQLPSDSDANHIMVEIYDTSGRKLHHSDLRAGSLDVSGFSSGLYYIRTSIAGEVYFSKVIIQQK